MAIRKAVLILLVLQLTLLDVISGSGCISRVWLYAQSSNEDSAGSDNDKTNLEYKFVPAPETITYHLYNNAGNDMDRNKGTVWDWDEPAPCVTVNDFKSMTLSSSGNDAWKIHTLVTYVTLDSDPTNKFYIMTHDFSIMGAVGGNLIPPDDVIKLHNDYVLHDTAAIANECVQRVTISISTGDDSSAAGKNHGFQFENTNGWGSVIGFYDHGHANDMYRSQSDMWIYEISEFFPEESCVTFGSITGAKLVAQSIYGWQIKHAFINAEISGGWALLAAELYINKWLDTNGSGHVSSIPVIMRNKQPMP